MKLTCIQNTLYYIGLIGSRVEECVALLHYSSGIIQSNSKKLACLETILKSVPLGGLVTQPEMLDFALALKSAEQLGDF